MSIQRNPGWRAFEKGIFIYRHYCSKFTKIYKKYIYMGQWYRYHSHLYRYHLCKKWQWPFGTGTAGWFWANLGFLIPFTLLCHTHTPPLLYRQTLTHFSPSHEQIRDHVFLPVFSSFRSGLFSVHRTDVVSAPHFFRSIFFLLRYFIVSHGLVWVAWIGGFLFLVA